MKHTPTAAEKASERSRGLTELAIAVREKTILLLDTFDEPGSLWTPPGTSNHGLWHAGHSLWLQDALCLRVITGKSELPAEWTALFRMGSRPGQQNDWPAKSQVRMALLKQLPRLIETIRSVAPTGWDSPPPFATPSDSRTLFELVSHGLHDEANHQGEMYLLLKLHRYRN